MGRKDAVKRLAELRAKDEMGDGFMPGSLVGDLFSHLERIERAVLEKPVARAQGDERTQKLRHRASPGQIAPDFESHAPADALEVGRGAQAQLRELGATILQC